MKIRQWKIEDFVPKKHWTQEIRDVAVVVLFVLLLCAAWIGMFFVVGAVVDYSHIGEREIEIKQSSVRQECSRYENVTIISLDWINACCFDIAFGSFGVIVTVTNGTSAETIRLNVSGANSGYGSLCIEAESGYLLSSDGKTINTAYCNSIPRHVPYRRCVASSTIIEVT